MAKDIVFESERYEKRQSVKRYLFPAVGILIILAVAVTVTLLLRGRRTVITGGEDTPYPYTWTVNKDGSALLEIDHAAAPDFAWRLLSASQGLSVQPAEETKEQKTRFALTPESEGRMALSFVLQRAEDAADRVYELFFLVEAQKAKDKFDVSPVSVAGKPLQGTLRGGAEGPFPYTIRTDGDGDLMITVTLGEPEEEALPDETAEEEITEEEIVEDDAVSPDWSCESSEEAVALPLGVIYGDYEVAAYFRPGEVPGDVTLRMIDAVTGTCITMECRNSEDGSLQVLSHGITAG